MGNSGGKLADDRQTLHVRKRAIALLDPLAVGDVDGGTDVAEKFAVFGEARRALVEDPTVFAVMPAQPVFDLGWASCIERRVTDVEAMLAIIGMHALYPP